MARKHKMHLRHITLQLMPSVLFKVSCGASAEWTVNTTSDVEKVDCLRCKRSRHYKRLMDQE